HRSWSAFLRKTKIPEFPPAELRESLVRADRKCRTGTRADYLLGSCTGRVPGKIRSLTSFPFVKSRFVLRSARPRAAGCGRGRLRVLLRSARLWASTGLLMFGSAGSGYSFRAAR